MNRDKITKEYIRGIIESKGVFTFYTNSYATKKGIVKRKIPAFVLELNEKDIRLLEEMRNHLCLKHRIYKTKQPALISDSGAGRRAYPRSPKVRLCVRDFVSLKNIILPLLYKELIGYKGILFEEWLERIGKEENIPDDYRLIYRLYKSGFYENERISKN